MEILGIQGSRKNNDILSDYVEGKESLTVCVDSKTDCDFANFCTSIFFHTLSSKTIEDDFPYINKAASHKICLLSLE